MLNSKLHMKTTIVRRLVVLAVLFWMSMPHVLLMQAQEEKAKETNPVDYLVAAEGAAAWMATLAKEADSDIPGMGTRWLTASGQKKALSMNSLYGGGAGIVLFYINLFKVTGNEKYKGIALQGGQGLLARASAHTGANGRSFRWLEREMDAEGRIYTYSKPSLYGGGSGIGWLFLQLHREFELPEYLQAARAAANGVLDAGDLQDGMLSFDGGWTDILSGNAGILLFFLELHRSSGKTADLDRAKQCAAWLMNVARREGKDQYYWRSREGDKNHISVSPNFSNGVAGVGYAFARLYEATGDETYLSFARGAMRWMKSKAQHSKNGLKWCQYYDPADARGQKRFRTGWCHGPAGSGRFFRKMLSIASEEEDHEMYQELVGGAEAYLLEAVRPHARYPVTKNHGRCCGAAGVGMYWLRYRQQTAKANYLPAARALADVLLQRADKSQPGMTRWADDPVPGQGEARLYPTSFMMGAAGIGDFLLHVFVAASDKDVELLVLPDGK